MGFVEKLSVAFINILQRKYDWYDWNQLDEERPCNVKESEFFHSVNKRQKVIIVKEDSLVDFCNKCLMDYHPCGLCQYIKGLCPSPPSS